MINTVIFDIGKVLAGYGWEKYLRGIAPEEEAYRAVEQAVFLSPDWVEHDKGLLTEEEEIRDFISNAPEYEKEIRQTYENLGECVWKLDYALSWVQDLKSRGFRVFALSNWPKHIYDQRKDKLDFLDLMDGYILSYQEHVIKPDPAAFRLLLERYRIEPEKAVFIDDTLKNIEAAERLGIHGIHFRSLEQAKGELEKLGVGE